jgi:predicted heme/steroid binding protein
MKKRSDLIRYKIHVVVVVVVVVILKYRSIMSSAIKHYLQYKPLWTLQEGMFMTVKAFSHLRNQSPSLDVVEKAKVGNLIACGMFYLPPSFSFSEKSNKHVSTGVGESFKDVNALPTYTLDQVALHNKAEDAWVVIDGLVYDLTRYVDAHPGGDKILSHVGGDASSGFHGPQHPSHVKETVKKFLVGRVKQ